MPKIENKIYKKGIINFKPISFLIIYLLVLFSYRNKEHRMNNKT